MQPKSETSLVMSGRLAEFQLADVLQAVGASRECTAVELRRHDGHLDGTIWIQAGRVIACEHGAMQGRPAFYDLFGATSADIFVVQRRREPPPATTPLGSVASLVLEALEHAPFAKGSQVTPLPALPRPPTADGVWDEPTVFRPPRKGGALTIAVASARGGVGRTTMTVQLGRALARAGWRTILVDGDGTGDLATLARIARPLARPAVDLLDGADAIDEALRDAPEPRLRVLPVAAPAPGRHSVAAEWQALLARTKTRADLVLVDCAAGTAGVAGDVIAACTHVVGVVRSDRVAAASAAALERHLEWLPGERRPELAGTIVNLFDGRFAASVEAFQRIAASGTLLFETTIPRAEALASDDAESASPIAWLFDAVAAELGTRVRLVDAYLVPAGQ